MSDAMFVSGFLGFFYALFGVLVTTHPGFRASFNGNLVKHVGVALVWPLAVLVALFKLTRWTVERLITDACALLPVAKKPETPKQVTVAMLAEDAEKEYTPGLWMS